MATCYLVNTSTASSSPWRFRTESDRERAGSRSGATAVTSAGHNPADPSARATPQQLAQWDRVRAFARDPNFVIDDQILKRYAGVPSPRRLANDELVIIMMASAMRADLARVMRETWLRAHPHVLIVGDAENASVPVHPHQTVSRLSPEAFLSSCQCASLHLKRAALHHPALC